MSFTRRAGSRKSIPKLDKNAESTIIKKSCHIGDSPKKGEDKYFSYLWCTFSGGGIPENEFHFLWTLIV